MFSRGKRISRLPRLLHFSGLCSDLYMLCHDAAHRSRRLLLHSVRRVGVGAEREARVEVAQHTGHGFDVHAVLQCQRCEAVALAG